MTAQVVPHALDWVPCSQYLPPADPEMGPERSVSVLVLRRSGGYCLAHTDQYRDPWEEDEPEVYPLHWHTSDSEAWDITDDVLCWRNVPSGPDTATREYFLSLEKGDERP